MFIRGYFFGSGKEGRSWCCSGQNSLAMVGYRGKSLQLYVGYSLEGNYYLRGFWSAFVGVSTWFGGIPAAAVICGRSMASPNHM